MRGVGWVGGSHERPRFQSTAQEVFARGQLDVVECGTGMTAAVIQVFIQPQPEVSTKKKIERKWSGIQEKLRKVQLASEDSGWRHEQRKLWIRYLSRKKILLCSWGRSRMEETRKNNTLAWESSQGLGSFLLRDLALQRVLEKPLHLPRWSVCHSLYI